MFIKSSAAGIHFLCLMQGLNKAKRLLFKLLHLNGKEFFK